jgi:FeS assembly SUF system protein
MNDPESPKPEEPQATATATLTDPSDLENGIVEALKTVYDPEIPVNIYELGLIYDIDIQEEGVVKVKMTLTAPGCPVAGTLPGEVRDKVAGVPGVTSADVELVWDPAWNPSMMSEAARLELGMF